MDTLGVDRWMKERQVNTRSAASRRGDPAAIIRRAGRSDLHDVAQLWARAGLPAPVRGFRNELLRLRARDPELLLIALREGRVVGAIAGSYDGRTAVVSRLAVERDVRRQGVATALVEQLCQQLADLGATVDELLVIDTTTDADAFWASIGWAPSRSIRAFVRSHDRRVAL